MSRPSVEEVDLSNYSYLTTKKGVCGGRPIIRGTRIEPEHICMYMNVKQVQHDHPELAPEAILECFHYFTHCI